MINEEQVKNIVKKVLDEEHLTGFIKTFEKEHNLFRGSHDKIGLPESIITQIVEHAPSTFEGLSDTSVATPITGDFVQYDGVLKKWKRIAALTEGSIIFLDSNGYFTEDPTNLVWDNSNNFLGVGLNSPVCRVHIRGAESSSYAGVSADTVLVLENAANVKLHLQGGVSGTAYIDFCDDTYNPPAGRVAYDFANDQIEFVIAKNEILRIKAGPTFDFYNTLTFQGADVHIKEALNLSRSTAEIRFSGPGGDRGIKYADTVSADRWCMRFPAGSHTVEILNRAVHGIVEIHANTLDGGVAGDVKVVTIEDTHVTIHAGLEIRFSDIGDSNFVGFKAPALDANQIWVLPATDGNVNDIWGTNGSGGLIWRRLAYDPDYKCYIIEQ